MDVIAAMPEVDRVTPILYFANIIEANGSKLFAFVVGLQPGEHRAGPWEMSAGHRIAGKGEAVIPDVLSRITGIGIGDTLRIVTLDDLADILSAEGTYSYLLVDAKEGVSPTQHHFHDDHDLLGTGGADRGL